MERIDRSAQPPFGSPEERDWFWNSIRRLEAERAELLEALQAVLEKYNHGISWAYSEGAMEDDEFTAALAAEELAATAIRKATGKERP